MNKVATASTSYPKSMKTLIYIYLISVLILGSSAAYAQQKKDTKIIVHLTDTSNITNKVALAMIDLGYPIELKDASLQYVCTGERGLQKIVATSKLQAVVKDHNLVVTGLIRLDVTIMGTKDSFSPVEYRGAKGSAYRTIWDEMLSIAKQFGTEITYSK